MALFTHFSSEQVYSDGRRIFVVRGHKGVGKNRIFRKPDNHSTGHRRSRTPRRVYSNILLPRPARGLLKNIGMFEKSGFGFRLRLLVQRKGGAPRPASARRARRRGWPHRCRPAGGMGCRSRFPDSRTTGKNCGVQLQLFQPRAFAVTGIKGGELFAAGLQRGGNML